jgi:predicted RNA-binding protein with TRAM domain
MKGKYDKKVHDDYIECKKCHSKNAPSGSKDFTKFCHSCGVELDTEAPVSVGDEITIFVDDMHESGAGVGKTESGYIVFVEGVVPESVVEVEVTDIRESYARAKRIGDSDMEPSDFRDDDDDDEDDKGLKREDFWGE